MTRYAESTTVPSDRSRAEIERILTRYGADGFMYGWEGKRALIAFRMDGRHIRFELPLPKRDDFTRTELGNPRTPTARDAAYEQAVRQRWRALALVIKAKLEAVETGISEFDREFMAHILLPDGQTIGDWMEPQIDEIYRTGEMPALLPGAQSVLALPEGKR